MQNAGKHDELEFLDRKRLALSLGQLAEPCGPPGSCQVVPDPDEPTALIEGIIQRSDCVIPAFRLARVISRPKRTAFRSWSEAMPGIFTQVRTGFLHDTRKSVHRFIHSTMDEPKNSAHVIPEEGVMELDEVKAYASGWRVAWATRTERWVATRIGGLTLAARDAALAEAPA